MQPVRKTETHTNYVPEGFSTVTPFLMVEDAKSFIEFAKKAVGAEAVSVLHHSSGKVFHAQIKIGNSMIMIGDSMGKKEHNIPAMLYLYVEDSDVLYKKAIAAGATSVMEPVDQFYGDRNAGVRDTFGNTWWFARKIEDVSPEELGRRAQEWEKNTNK